MSATKSTTFVGRRYPYLEMDEVADLLNAAAGKNVHDARSVRRLLAKDAALTKLGERWVTTRRRLRDALPDVWDELLIQLGEVTDDDVA